MTPICPASYSAAQIADEVRKSAPPVRSSAADHEILLAYYEGQWWQPRKLAPARGRQRAVLNRLAPERTIEPASGLFLE
jgi:hypothetical protein